MLVVGKSDCGAAGGMLTVYTHAALLVYAGVHFE